MTRNLLALVLCGMIMILSGCQNTNNQSHGQETSGNSVSESRNDSMSGEASPADASLQDNSSPSQNPLFLSTEYLPEYDMQNNINRLSSYCETDTMGYYKAFTEDPFLWYYDKSSGKCGKLCSRPECTHDNENCDAFVPPGNGLCYYDGKLYFLGDIQTNDIVKKQQMYHGLYSLSLDGTERRYVQDVNINTDGNNGVFRLHRGYIYYGVIDNNVMAGEAQTRVMIRRQVLGDSSAEAEILFEKKVEPGKGCDYFFQISGTYMYLLVKEHLLADGLIQYEEFEAYTIDLTENTCKSVGPYHLEDGYFTTDMHELNGILYISRYNPLDQTSDLIVESINMATGEWERICSITNEHGTYPFIGDGVLAGVGTSNEMPDADKLLLISGFNGEMLYEQPIAMTDNQSSCKEVISNLIIRSSSDEVLVELSGRGSGATVQEQARSYESLFSFVHIAKKDGNWTQTIIKSDN